MRSYGRYNFGNLYSDLGRPMDAVGQYQKAIRINQDVYPAKINLAMTFEGLNKKTKALALLCEVFEANPTFFNVAYSIGLLLASDKKYEEAARYLKIAADGLPKNARIKYNLGLLFQMTGKMQEAETRFASALSLDPVNRDFLFALSDHYRRRAKFEKAEILARKLLQNYPTDKQGQRLIYSILNNQNN